MASKSPGAGANNRSAIPSATSGPKGDQHSSGEDEDIGVDRSKSKLRKSSLEKEMERRATREREWEREIKRARSRSRERHMVMVPATTTVERSASSAAVMMSSKRVQRPEHPPPPVPPPRTHSRGKVDSRKMKENRTPPVVKQTPYQFWREQRFKASYQISPVPTPEPLKEGFFGRRFVPRRRERNLSGASSSSTEPVPAAESTKRKKKSSLSEMFSFSRKKSTEEQQETRKTSATEMLVKSTMMRPEVHSQLINLKEEEVATNGSSPKSKEVPTTDPVVVGTVLHPQAAAPRTPFQEWRHYRQQNQRNVQQQQSYHHSAPPPARSDTSSPISRLRTPDPDYFDNMSVGSGVSSRSSYYRTSNEDLHRQVGPQYYSGHVGGIRSSSAMGIPRFSASTAAKSRSLFSASPRLELHSNSSADSYYGRHGAHLMSAESHEWYSGYQHQVPHEAEFSISRANFDGRIKAGIGKKKRGQQIAAQTRVYANVRCPTR